MGVVMPDHTHLLLQALANSAGTYIDLAEIMQGLKGASARSINKLLGRGGALWQEEYFDRIMRDAAEYEEKMEYMWKNPVKAGLVGNPEDYDFFVFPPEPLE